MIRADLDLRGPLFEKAADVVLRKVLKANIAALTGFIRAKVVERTPVNTGALRNSIQEEIEERDDEIIGRVATNIEYAVPVEFGTKPHFPPIDPLTYWARRKLGISGAEARSVAFRIARKIAQRGTEGYRMFEYGLEEGEKVARKTSKALGIEISRELGG